MDGTVSVPSGGDSPRDMVWRRQPQGDPDDPDGVSHLLRNLHTQLGGPPLGGTRFLQSTRDMLRLTRTIEALVFGEPTTLYAGFQSADMPAKECREFTALTASGTRVVAFGTGSPACDCGVRWVQVPVDAYALENQWYLITAAPRPQALVAFRIAGAARLAAHSGDGKLWEGFLSEDDRLVDALITHLEDVAARYG